jgi:hypothetical protein
MKPVPLSATDSSAQSDAPAPCGVGDRGEQGHHVLDLDRPGTRAKRPDNAGPTTGAADLTFTDGSYGAVARYWGAQDMATASKAAEQEDER